MRYKNALMIFTVLLAVILPLVIAVKSEIARTTSPVIKVKITTYDPRDLFYGQYMTYRFNWNWKDGPVQDNVCRGEDCCLCVGEGDVDPVVSMKACAPARQDNECRHVVQGSFRGTDFDPGFNRYYVDERHAYPLEKLFFSGTETFRIGLGLQSSGKAVLQGLYINDQSLDEYLKDHGGVVPVPPSDSTP